MKRIFKMLIGKINPSVVKHETPYQLGEWIVNRRSHQIGTITRVYRDTLLVLVGNQHETWLIEDCASFTTNSDTGQVSDWFVEILRDGRLTIARVLSESCELTGAFGNPPAYKYLVCEHNPVSRQRVTHWIPDYLIVNVIAPVAEIEVA